MGAGGGGVCASCSEHEEPCPGLWLEQACFGREETDCSAPPAAVGTLRPGCRHGKAPFSQALCQVRHSRYGGENARRCRYPAREASAWIACPQCRGGQQGPGRGGEESGPRSSSGARAVPREEAWVLQGKRWLWPEPPGRGRGAVP